MDTSARAPSPYSVSKQAIIAYALAACFLCFEMALQVSPGVMTQDLMRDLAVDARGVGLITSAYFTSYTVMQIPVGLLFDRYSVRWLISFAILICSMGAIFFGMTHSLFFAALGRFFMGFGSAFAFISVLIVASQWFEARFFALLVGIAQCLAALGAWSGEAPFAVAIDLHGWRAVINGFAMVGMVLMVLCWLAIRDKQPADSLLDADSKHIDTQHSILEVIRSSQSWWVALYAFACWAPITVFPATWGTAYLVQRFNVPRSEAAWAVGFIWIGLAVASPIVGWLSDRIGRRNVLMQFCGALGATSSLLILFNHRLPFVAMYPLLFVFGVACAGQILSFAVVKENSKPQVRATAIGFNNMAVVAGGMIFPYLVGWLLHQFWQGTASNVAPIYTVGNYESALLVVPLCFVLTLVSSMFFIRETHCQSAHGQ